jgi:thioesterase domain-containing protein
VAPSGPVRLCGHSAGGTVAYALASRLSAKGRDVQFLGLLDAAPEVSDPRRDFGFEGDIGAELARMREHARQGGLAGLLQDRLVMVLLRLQAFEILRRLVIWRSRSGAHRAAYTRQSLLIHARGRALLTWKARPYPQRVTLFAARDRKAGAIDLGWTAFASNLDLVEIPGEHSDMLDSPNVEVLAAAFLKAVQASATRRA